MSTAAMARRRWLRCEGPVAARIASCLHYAWPFARGQWRYTDLLRRTRWKSFAAVPFRSRCGVRVSLDMGSDQFLYLSGRVPNEPLELAIMEEIVRPDDVFIDVGAHRGLYVLHLLGRLGPQGLYFAVEPSPTNFAFLEQAFRDDHGRLRRLRLALSDTDGESRLAEEGASTAYLATDAGGIPTPTARLDTLLADTHMEDRGLVVKIDTEGHEARIIRGASGLAARGVRPLFLAEFLPSIHGQTRGDVTSAIEEAFGSGYRYFGIDLRANALVEFQPSSPPLGEVNNIIAVPREAFGRLAGCPFA